MRKFVIFLGALFLATVQAEAQEDTNKFRSDTLGISVTKPESWRWISSSEYFANLERTEWNDKEFGELLRTRATAPLAAIMKYPEPFDDVNPSFKINVKPYGSLKGYDPKDILKLVTGHFQKSLNDLKVVKPTHEVKVSEIESGYMMMNYTLKIPDGRTFPITSEIWIVPRERMFFIVGSGTRTDETTGTRAEIKEIMDTLKIK